GAHAHARGHRRAAQRHRAPPAGARATHLRGLVRAQRPRVPRAARRLTRRGPRPVSQIRGVLCLGGKASRGKDRLMRVFVTGATGAVGRHLVPMLVAAGHQVTATTKTPGKAAQLREAGATAVIVDGLDRAAVITAVAAAAPDVIVHEMTALTDMRNLRNLDRVFAATNELRVRGTDNLL